MSFNVRRFIEKLREYGLNDEAVLDCLLMVVEGDRCAAPAMGRYVGPKTPLRPYRAVRNCIDPTFDFYEDDGQPCSVYIMGTIKHDGSAGPCKIGLSNNAAERVKAVQTGNPFRVWLVAEVRFRCLYAAQMLEHVTHGAMHGSRLNGEWFDASPAECVEGLTDVLKDAWRADYGEDWEKFADWMKWAGNEVAA